MMSRSQSIVKSVEQPRRKLSASALNTFLRSPKAYYFGYIARLEPISPSVATFDEAKLCGILWAEYVDRFYKEVSEAENTKKLLDAWHEQTHGWVPEKQKDKLTKALETWAATYYQEFSPDDGVRNGSEKHVENDRFVGYLDGLSADATTIHEVKSTSRAQQVSEQLWKVQNSIQVKLYAVLTGASGACIEFAFKDPPYSIYRAPVVAITAEQRKQWEQELNALADRIYSLGDDSHNYPCHTDGCCITSRFMTSICPYSAFCSGVEGAEVAFKPREHRK